MELEDLGAFLADLQFEQEPSTKALLIANIIRLRNATSSSERAMYERLVAEFKRDYQGDPHTIVLDKKARIRWAVKITRVIHQTNKQNKSTFSKAAQKVSEALGIPVKTILNNRHLK